MFGYCERSKNFECLSEILFVNVVTYSTFGETLWFEVQTQCDLGEYHLELMEKVFVSSEMEILSSSIKDR